MVKKALEIVPKSLVKKKKRIEEMNIWRRVGIIGKHKVAVFRNNKNVMKIRADILTITKTTKYH